MSGQGEAGLAPEIIGKILTSVELGMAPATAALAHGVTREQFTDAMSDETFRARVEQAAAKYELHVLRQATAAAIKGDKRAAEWLRKRADAEGGTSAVDPAATPTTSAKSEGQRLLLAINASHNEVAASVGTSKQLVSYWRRGEKVPGKKFRAKLEDLYGIPPSAWERVPYAGGTPPAAPPPARASVADDLDEIDHLRDLLRDLRRLRRDTGLTATARARVASEESKTIGRLEALRARRELLEDRVVREHPAWHRLRDAILRALEPFPEASQAVIAAIDEAWG